MEAKINFPTFAINFISEHIEHEKKLFSELQKRQQLMISEKKKKKKKKKKNYYN